VNPHVHSGFFTLSPEAIYSFFYGLPVAETIEKKIDHDMIILPGSVRIFEIKDLS
jgi:hypothetical protein